MGVSIMYGAMPPDSHLYQRIQTERAICILVKNLTMYGSGLFDFFEMGSRGEMREILEGIVDYNPETFPSKRVAKRAIADLRSEIDRICKASPGIVHRTAMLEKSSEAIKQSLLPCFEQQNIRDAESMIDLLLCGDSQLAPAILNEEDDPIGVISLELVATGAKVLGPIEPETLHSEDPYWHEWGLLHFKEWRELYLSAHQHGEVIFVSIG